MKLSAQLKTWLVQNMGVKEDASDDEFRKAAGEALATAKLVMADYIKMTEPDQEEVNEFAEKQQQLQATISDGFEKLATLLTKQQSDGDDSTPADSKSEGGQAQESNEKGSSQQPPDSTKTQPSNLEKLIASMGSHFSDLGGTQTIDVRVKEAAEQYSTTKSTAVYPDRTKNSRPHPFAGMPVKVFDRSLDNLSDRERAFNGSYWKFLILRAKNGGSSRLGFDSLTQHEQELMYYGLENMLWDDTQRNRAGSRKLTPAEQKQVITETGGSGGQEAVPIVFDDALIMAPLLHGELLPLVNQVPIDRGNLIEGVIMDTTTQTNFSAWGGADATAITLFTTTGFIAAFDNTIFRWQGAIQLGLDFLSDSPIDFGSQVSSRFGETLLRDLDRAIASGNGTTMPQGVMSAGGTAVNFTGAHSIGGYENLRFTVPKQEHGATVANTAVFCGTETSYERARALNVGASDARRLFGMNYDSYSIMERPYKVVDATAAGNINTGVGLVNTQLFYAILARYRLYRRRGLTIRTSTEGDTLVRGNLMLITAMSRWGGRMERAAASAVVTDAPA